MVCVVRVLSVQTYVCMPTIWPVCEYGKSLWSRDDHSCSVKFQDSSSKRRANIHIVLQQLTPWFLSCWSDAKCSDLRRLSQTYDIVLLQQTKLWSIQSFFKQSSICKNPYSSFLFNILNCLSHDDVYQQGCLAFHTNISNFVNFDHHMQCPCFWSSYCISTVVSCVSCKATL